MVAEILASGTPTTNSGVNSEENSGLKCRVDWLAGTFSAKYLDFVFSIASSFLGGLPFEKRNCGVKHFEVSYRHPTGVLIGVGHRQPDLPPNYDLAFLEIKGSHLAPVTASRVRKLLKVLLGKVGFSFSHLDINIDDYKKRLDIKQMRRAVRKGHFTGFRKKTVKYEELGADDSEGLSLAFGRRGRDGAGKRLIFYDKELESNGLIKAIRAELNLYGHLAQQAARHLAYSPLVNWGEIIRSWICSSIDFIRRPKTNDHKALSNCPRLPWWKFFAEGTFKIEPDIPYKISTIEGKIKFLKRIAPTIALVVNAILKKGSYDDLIYELFALCFDGESRFTKYHLHLLELW